LQLTSGWRINLRKTIPSLNHENRHTAQLLDAYNVLHPTEHKTPQHQDLTAARADLERIFNNWLKR
jgi:hypothetical protein